MADRPILFTAPMVRALLDGRKTQTRRIMKVQPPKQEDFPGSLFGINRKVADGVKMFSLNDYDRLPKHPTHWDLDGSVGIARDAGFPRVYDARFAIGDRLWVRETWRVSPDACEGWNPIEPHPSGWVDYRAGGSDERPAPDFEAVCRATFGKSGDIDWDCVPIDWRPSIFMPRWTSRLTLAVTDVRIERLNACSEADAIAEGLEWVAPGKWAVDRTLPIIGDDPRRVYSELWDYINGPGAWATNPWVVAVSFEVRKGNIDG